MKLPSEGGCKVTDAPRGTFLHVTGYGSPVRPLNIWGVMFWVQDSVIPLPSMWGGSLITGLEWCWATPTHEVLAYQLRFLVSSSSRMVNFWPRASFTWLPHCPFGVWNEKHKNKFSFFFRSASQKSVSFLNDWNLITTIPTGQGSTPVGMWHWNELGSINLDPKRDLDRRPYCFFPCLLRADSL